MNTSVWLLALLAVAVQPPRAGLERLPPPMSRQAVPREIPAERWPAEEQELPDTIFQDDASCSKCDSGRWSRCHCCGGPCGLGCGLRAPFQILKARGRHCLGLGAGGLGQSPCHDWWCSGCDLSQHAVSTMCHGYYYFHPYHLADLESQRTFATSWGGDVRNPYDNQVLKDVYTQWKSEQNGSVEAERPESSELPPPRPERPRVEEGPLRLPDLPDPAASAGSRSSAGRQASMLNAPQMRRRAR